MHLNYLQYQEKNGSERLTSRNLRSLTLSNSFRYLLVGKSRLDWLEMQDTIDRHVKRIKKVEEPISAQNLF